MTGLVFLTAQIHAKDQSRMSLAVNWKKTNQIDSKMYFKQFYDARMGKRINTKNYRCSITPIKFSKCVDDFLMANFMDALKIVKQLLGLKSKLLQ